MRHHIIVKFKNKETLKDLKHIKEIFKPLLDISGINKIEYHTTCVDLDNRYHLMIIIDMDKEVLPTYNESLPHKKWKEEYSSLIEAKAIFDYED